MGWLSTGYRNRCDVNGVQNGSTSYSRTCESFFSTHLLLATGGTWSSTLGTSLERYAVQ